MTCIHPSTWIHPYLRPIALSGLISLAVATCGSAGNDDPAASGADPALGMAFTGMRLVDGRGGPPVDDGILWIRNGRVEAAGPAGTVDLPQGVPTRTLPGRTIMPGIINGHGHVSGLVAPGDEYNRANLIRQLEIFARYGVTTVVSLGGDGPEAVQLREEQEAPGPGRARIWLAGPVIAPWTEEEAREQVAQVAAMGADWVKIRVDDGLGQREKMPSNVYAAVAEAAHSHGLPLAAHMVDLEDARGLLRAGADLLAHSVRDAPVDDALISELVERGVCLSPTLTREVSTFAYGERPDFFDDPFFQAGASPEAVSALLEPERQAGFRASEAGRYFQNALPQAMENMMALHRGGVGIAFGTDAAPSLGRFAGYFEHMEMGMMVEAGMTPGEVVHSATGVAAACTGLEGVVGTLEPGAWADFLVLGADPLADIRNLRQLEEVWVGGEPLAVPPFSATPREGGSTNGGE
ncbi:MAG: amidohydrolase family protein [Gemmatimonadota bacterium]